MPLEAAIQLRIVAALRSAGAYVTKFSAGDVGTPDLLVCYQGRFFGMEVKQPKNYATKIQRHRLEQIALAGGIGVVVRSVDEALAALESRLDEVRPTSPRSARPPPAATANVPAPRDKQPTPPPPPLPPAP